MPQADPKSSSGQEKQQTAQTFSYPSTYPQQFEDDTIDLYELLITLWKWKWLVIAMTIVVALGSIVYALQLQHVYKAETLLLPPKDKDLHSIKLPSLLNIETKQNSTNFEEITPEAVFNKFKKNLNSRVILKKFIQEKGLMELLAPHKTSETRDEDIFNGFAQLITLEKKSGITSMSIELHDAEIAAQWVNDLTKFVDKETVVSLVEDSKNSIANQIMKIEYTIASKRQMAKQRRHDQIVRYKEAAAVADKLGIKRRVDATNIIQNTQMNVDIATATTPLYYLGFEALTSEIKILENRESDDPFISGLRDLQEKLALLRSIKINAEKISSVQIDQAAYPNKSPTSTSRRMIVYVATAVGLLSGIFLAFLIEFVKNQRKKHSG